MNYPWSWPTLSEGQIEQIRDAALAYIERHGFVVQDATLVASARARGAQVDEAQGRIRVPRTLVAELMATLPRRYIIRNILGESWEVGGGTPYGTAIVTDPWIIDYRTGEPRRPRLEDVRRHTIIAEQLDSVVGISRMDFPVTDVPGSASSPRALEIHLLNHTRHYHVMAAGLESFDEWTDIGTILARGGDPGPLITSAVAVGSPMVLNVINCELLKRSVSHGFTIQPTICPMAGATAPYSLAGTLLQSHIEVLMIAMMCQLLRPGHPVIYGTGLSVTDLQTGADLYYTLDKVLWKLAAVQLGRAEHMPTWAECGGSLTHRYDPQCGAEGMLFMLAAHASAADMISGFGSCHNAVGMSAEMMIIQEAWLRAARHLTRGIRTDDLRLGMASLERVGPGGQFLDDDLTVELMRSDEFFRNDIFDLGGGHADGQPMLERAHAWVAQLVDGYQSRVPGDIQENLRRHFHERYPGSTA